MPRFKGECAHFIFNRCPICTHDGASAKFSTNSQETDYNVCSVLFRTQAAEATLRNSLDNLMNASLEQINSSTRKKRGQWMPSLRGRRVWSSRPFRGGRPVDRRRPRNELLTKLQTGSEQRHCEPYCLNISKQFEAKIFSERWHCGKAMDQISMKTPNPKCPLYWCLI